MSELRLNLITREWVIISPDREGRPSDFNKDFTAPSDLPDHNDKCHFCKGNEALSEGEVVHTGHVGLETDDWLVRVVNNKYPALQKDGEKTRITEGVKRFVSGVGLHEVIIDSPNHSDHIAIMDTDHISELLKVYRDRFVNAYEDPRIEHVMIYRNHGEKAGTSTIHPHSQLIAIPVTPQQLRDRVQGMMQHFDDTGKCLVCDILKSELSEKSRIIKETDHFVTHIPYAALGPYHTWIMPKRHSATFADITDDERSDLAVHLKSVLFKLYKALGNPSYNYVIRSSRPVDKNSEFSHWYLSVVPRLNPMAGFELGTGMYINTHAPEKDAEFLRSVAG